MRTERQRGREAREPESQSGRNRARDAGRETGPETESMRACHQPGAEEPLRPHRRTLSRARARPKAARAESTRGRSSIPPGCSPRAPSPRRSPRQRALAQQLYHEWQPRTHAVSLCASVPLCLCVSDCVSVSPMHRRALRQTLSVTPPASLPASVAQEPRAGLHFSQPSRASTTSVLVKVTAQTPRCCGLSEVCFLTGHRYTGVLCTRTRTWVLVRGLSD